MRTIEQALLDIAHTFCRSIVEYSDPSGIFPSISNHLQRRLPLRNLHWTSTSRPLRSISSLHVELVPDHRPLSRGASARPGSGDVSNANPNGTRERRHQIPGLRQTPYLKIYLLRCKDSETYKSTSRKLLREWVKDHTPPSQSSSLTNKADNHDAFEWLIVHVVMSNEESWKGPRLSGSYKGEAHLEKASGGSRWSARGSSSLIEKIRSDFNATSKTAVDRVAQIQIDGAGEIEVSTRSDLQDKEEQNGFNDLTFKLKSLILASFDQRVSQYEEDIREKDSQRNLPGWNFNTFFLLKEGLARGFESVGLVEDALTSYHELSASLTAIAASQLTRTSSGGGANNFGDFTDDLLDALRRAIHTVKAALNQETSSDIADTPKHDNENGFHHLGAAVLDTNRKPFRELILANKISAFDFQCYVFARQVSLLLRLANLVPPKEMSPTDGASDEEHHMGDSRLQQTKRTFKANQPEANLSILADVCRQAVHFITSISRVLRNDFYSSRDHLAQSNQGLDVISNDIVECIIENLVASWTFSACESILEKTYASSLLSPLEALLIQFKEYNSISEFDQDGSPDRSSAARREDLPPRTSSLQSPHSITSGSIHPKRLPAVTLLDSARLLPPRSSQTGSQNLAAQRADLSNLSRGILGNLGLRHDGWGLFAHSDWSEDKMDDVPLEDTPTDVSIDPVISHITPYAPTRVGIENPLLVMALSSEDNFYASYEVTSQSLILNFGLILLLGINSVDIGPFHARRQA